MPTYRLLLVAALLAGCGVDQQGLTISAAASLQNPLQELARSYEQMHPGTTIAVNFGGSGMLAQQIEQGAPADIFFSASPKPMDDLAARGLIVVDTRRDLLRNQVVLIIPSGTNE